MPLLLALPCRMSERGASCGRWLQDNLLLLLMALSVLLGLVVGLSLSAAGVSLGYDALSWVSIWGELYLRMLDMVVLPLVASLVIVGTSPLYMLDSYSKASIVVQLFNHSAIFTASSES